MATDIDVKGRGPTGRDSATADRTRIHRRRALLQTALAAASAFAASEAIRGSDTTSAATDFMKYGATNDAVGSTTVLKSAFVNGTNFTVETSISNGGVATSIKGRTTGFVSQGGTAFGVEGVTSAPGLATSIGVYGHSEGAAPTNVGVKGDATGPTSVGVLGTAASIGVKGTSAAGFALHGTSSASGVGLYARSEHGIGVHAEATSGSAIYAANEDASFVTIDAVQVEGGYSLRSQNQTHLVGDAKFSNRLYGEGPNAKFEGNGAGLTALHANSIATGTLADARLSPNIPRINAAAVPFAGKVSAAQFSGPSGAPPVFPGAGAVGVRAGRSGVTVSTPGVGPKGHVLALFQSNPGPGVSVKHIEKVAGGFRAVFTAQTKRATTLAYFVVGQA